MHKNVEFDADFKTIGKVAEKFRWETFLSKKVWKSFCCGDQNTLMQTIKPDMHKMAQKSNFFCYVFELNFVPWESPVSQKGIK